MLVLKGKRNQLTTDESNQSRFVNKIRWVVEAVHGHIKQKFKLLDHKLDNNLQLKTHFFVEFRTSCIINLVQDLILRFIFQNKLLPR